MGSPATNLSVGFTVSEPVSAIIGAAAEIYKATLAYATTVRATMSDANKDAQDKITNQMYWDWSALLQKVGIVGDPVFPPK